MENLPNFRLVALAGQLLQLTQVARKSLKFDPVENCYLDALPRILINQQQNQPSEQSEQDEEDRRRRPAWLFHTLLQQAGVDASRLSLLDGLVFFSSMDHAENSCPENPTEYFLQNACVPNARASTFLDLLAKAFPDNPHREVFWNLKKEIERELNLNPLGSAPEIEDELGHPTY